MLFYYIRNTHFEKVNVCEPSRNEVGWLNMLEKLFTTILVRA